MAIPLERLEGKYEILDRMSEGGMGAVYKVRHRLLDEIRVIKVMRPHLADDEVLRARFVREAKTAIRLHHPCLAQVYDFTMDEDGTFWLVMEFIDGMDLLAMVKVVKVVPLAVALELAYQTLGVLGYLHQKNIVHRDISPDNLLVTRDDEDRILVKLIDLGIAKIQEENQHLTATGTFLGKVRYSSPEHFRSKDTEEVSPRSDLYSFAIVLYELLTGVHPIKGTSLSSLIAGHLSYPPVPFETSDPDGRVAPGLRAAILKALAKDPAERFASAREFQAELEELRTAHPATAAQVAAIFRVPTLPTMKIQVNKQSRTQAQIDRNFGVDTTPAHGTATEPGTLGRDGARQLAPRPPDRTTQTRERTDVALQARALVLGAEKLLEAGHVDEARFQLESARQIVPDHPDLARVTAALAALDAARDSRRSELVRQIEILIGADQVEQARLELTAAVDELGDAVGFAGLADAILRLEVMLAERADQARAILASARRLLAEDGWEDAAPMVREALVLDPTNKEAADLLDIVESGLVRWRENQRRQREIDNTVAAIGRQLDAEELDGAKRALGLARKLYGRLDDFTRLDRRLTDVTAKREERRLDDLCDQARTAMEAHSFDAAAKLLDQVLTALPGHPRAQELVAACAEAKRLHREAERRNQAIDEAARSIDRLILAGRLETALRSIDAAVASHGPFDFAAVLRARVDSELAARDSCAAAVAALVADARRAAAKHAFDRCGELLDTARRRAEEYPELLDQVQDAAMDAERLSQEHRRRLDLAAALASIARGLDAGQLDQAARELEVVERLYGDEPEIARLRQRHLELKRVAMAEAVDKLVKQSLAKQSSFTGVIAQLEEALRLDPGNELVQRLLAETRGAHLRHEQEKRAKAVAEVLAAVDGLIAAGRLADALAAVDQAVTDIGDFPAARSVRYRLRKALG